MSGILQNKPHMYKLYIYKGDVQNTQEIVEMLTVTMKSYALCSRNFQNVKLRHDFVDIGKSHFGEFKWSKNVVYGNFRDAEL